VPISVPLRPAGL